MLLASSIATILRSTSIDTFSSRLWLIDNVGGNDVEMMIMWDRKDPLKRKMELLAHTQSNPGALVFD